MKFQIVKDPVPFLLMDEIYSPDEEKLIFDELEFLRPKLAGPDITGTAFYQDGVTPKKKNNGVFIEEVYKHISYSNIVRLGHKIFNKEVADKAFECSPGYIIFPTAVDISALISYYDDGDHYDTHFDVSALTVLTWFFKQPQQFSGGDLIFPEYNVTVPVKHNAGIIFFSNYQHQVTKVIMNNSCNSGLGRYCISYFCSHQ